MVLTVYLCLHGALQVTDASLLEVAEHLGGSLKSLDLHRYILRTGRAKIEQTCCLLLAIRHESLTPPLFFSFFFICLILRRVRALIYKATICARIWVWWLSAAAAPAWLT